MTATTACLETLYARVKARMHEDAQVSYTASLLQKGHKKIAQKLGEEATECVIEASCQDKQALIKESSDLLYHLMVMWVDSGITPSDIASELRRREAMSGLQEKARRKK